MFFARALRVQNVRRRVASLTTSEAWRELWRCNHASDAAVGNSNPLVGRIHFRVCSQSLAEAAVGRASKPAHEIIQLLEGKRFFQNRRARNERKSLFGLL